MTYFSQTCLVIARIERKSKKIQEILEDTEEGIDEPHIYVIEYSHFGGGGYGPLVFP